MLVLFETSAGYALFKVLNEKKLKHVENLWQEFQTAEGAKEVLQQVAFQKFSNMARAVQAFTNLSDGHLGKELKKFLKKWVAPQVQETLAVADSRLGSLIKDKFNISCLSDTTVQELMRCIRSQLDSLIVDLPRSEISAMALGLAHSLSRFKLKFSADKIDTMVIQAIALLDDLDKEVNNFVMRLREWYGWHFPELCRVVPDALSYAKIVKTIGFRTNAVSCDLKDIVSEDVEREVKDAAEMSMGTDMTDPDIDGIRGLCDQIISLTEYKVELHEYLENRMTALAPNLRVLLGEIVGARLIAKAGSLLNLAKFPASTMQILGAEKALFRALKAKRDTPKYGLIYHAHLVGHTPAKLKGKMSRMLAAKAALACRVDALCEETVTGEVGAGHLSHLEHRLQVIQHREPKRISGMGNWSRRHADIRPYGDFETYDVRADSTLKQSKREAEGDEGHTQKKKRFTE